jgi:hypothetical protein
MIKRLEKRCDALLKKLIKKNLTTEQYEKGIEDLHNLEFKIYKLKTQAKAK